MSNILENAITGIVAEKIGRTTGAFVDIPVIERPVPDRPTPSGEAGTLSDQMYQVMSRGTTNVTQTATGQPVQTESDPAAPRDIGTVQFSPIPQATTGQIADSMRYSSSLSGRVGKSLFGGVPEYNVGTGGLNAAPLKLMGPASILTAFASFGMDYQMKKQRQAALNAARGLPNNGNIQIDGRNVAVVNGQIYGVLPENVSIADIQQRALGLVNSMSIEEKSGGMEPAYTRLGASARPYVDRLAEAQNIVDPQEYQYSADFSQTLYEDEVDDYSFGFAAGGKLGMQEGGVAQNAPMGFVGGPPENYDNATTVADTEETQLPEGSFVINAPAVEYAGSDDIRKMILDAYTSAKEKNLDIGRIDPKLYESNIDVALSKGEVVVPPELVKIIGLDRLEKINNRGKKEVTRRQKQARQGGFIDGYADGGDVVEGVGGIAAIEKAYGMYKDKMPSPEIARQKTEEIMEWMPAEDILTLVMMGEASVLGDKGMRGVGHVVVNRSNSNFQDFADQETVKDVLRKRTKSNIFQFNALEPTPFRRTLRSIVETEYGKKKFQRLRDAAEEILYGVEDDFTKGAVFFWNPEKSTDEDFINKVKSGQYIPTGEARSKSSMHQYLVPQQ